MKRWSRGAALLLAVVLLAACAKNTDVTFRELQARLPATLGKKYALSPEETAPEVPGPYLGYTVTDGRETVGALSFMRWDQLKYYYEAQQGDGDFAAYALESWRSWTVSPDAAADWLGLVGAEVLSCGDWDGPLPGVQITYRWEGMQQRDLYVLKNGDAYVIHDEAADEGLAALLDQVLESVS